MTLCEQCRDRFKDSPSNLARDVEKQFPNCACQQFSIGVGSPGPIGDEETLYRMFTDPVDVDEFGKVTRKAFSTAYGNGLSIIRECASDQDVEDQVIEILSVKPDKKRRNILAIFMMRCLEVRTTTMPFRGNAENAFCVYDQTVPRLMVPAAAQTPTHGIILSRCLFEAPTTRRQFENDCNDVLHRLITVSRIDVATFRGGMIARLNERSLAGEFIRT